MKNDAYLAFFGWGLLLVALGIVLGAILVKCVP